MLRQVWAVGVRSLYLSTGHSCHSPLGFGLGGKPFLRLSPRRGIAPESQAASATPPPASPGVLSSATSLGKELKARGPRGCGALGTRRPLLCRRHATAPTWRDTLLGVDPSGSCPTSARRGRIRRAPGTSHGLLRSSSLLGARPPLQVQSPRGPGARGPKRG